MSEMTVTKTRLFEGVWEGIVRGSKTKPTIEVTYLERPIGGVVLTKSSNGSDWVLRIPIPVEAIADGVQTFLIRDADADATLDVITMISGEVLADDIRAELDLLRAELDMLKRAFRRHCVETMDTGQ